MKASTLAQRIAKTANKNGSEPKKRDYQLAITAIMTGQRVQCGFSGRNFVKTYSPEKYLRAWGIDIESGNDAPRGGANGWFVKLTAKGKKQVSEYAAERRTAINNAKIQAEAAENKAKSDIQEEVAKYASLVEKIEGEEYASTCTRLSEAISAKIETKIFHKAVNAIRNR